MKPPAWAVFAGSIVFHILLFLLGFSRASGDLITRGAPPAGAAPPAMAVTLVDARAPTDAVEDAAALRLNLRRLTATEGVPIEAGHSASPAERLAERLRARAPPQPQARPGQRLQRAYGADSAETPAPAPPRKGETGPRGGETGAVSSGSLWGAIEPCWRRLEAPSQLAVSLEVSLDGRGRLSRPPQVIRAPAAVLTEPRLKSEARALDALSACLPKHDLTFAGRSFRLDFPAADATVAR